MSSTRLDDIVAKCDAFDRREGPTDRQINPPRRRRFYNARQELLKDQLRRQGLFEGTGKKKSNQRADGPFQQVEKKLEGKVRNPAAVAAAIGREELGQKEMTRRSVAGREK